MTAVDHNPELLDAAKQLNAKLAALAENVTPEAFDAR